eukprot:GHVS01075851.1.p1 GENE.GHVS01075851.1~~GHVS01075851.1.p1  ORF type:complete len:131 (-),score=15.78 GHVS01075851.1:243-635(-)
MYIYARTYTLVHFIVYLYMSTNQQTYLRQHPTHDLKPYAMPSSAVRPASIAQFNGCRSSSFPPTTPLGNIEQLCSCLFQLPLFFYFLFFFLFFVFILPAFLSQTLFLFFYISGFHFSSLSPHDAFIQNVY